MEVAAAKGGRSSNEEALLGNEHERAVYVPTSLLPIFVLALTRLPTANILQQSSGS